MKNNAINNIEFENSLVTLSCGERGIRASLKLNNIKSADEPALEFMASDDTLDRFGEIIKPEGWLLDRYKQNPVFQNSHQYGDIIFTIGKSEKIEIRKNPIDSSSYLYQRVRFAVEENPFARIAYNLYKGGFLNAVSVGFRPIKWLDGKEAHPAHRIYIEQELIEVSAVAIPANHNALALSAKIGITKHQDIEECREILRSMLTAYEEPYQKTKETVSAITRKKTGFCRAEKDNTKTSSKSCNDVDPWRRLRLLLSALTEALNKINAEQHQ